LPLIYFKFRRMCRCNGFLGDRSILKVLLLQTSAKIQETLSNGREVVILSITPIGFRSSEKCTHTLCDGNTIATNENSIHEEIKSRLRVCSVLNACYHSVQNLLSCPLSGNYFYLLFCMSVKFGLLC